MSIAWTPGTKGLVSGECVLIGDMEDSELRRTFAGKLRGKWVLGQAPAEMRAQWDPLARRLSQADLDLLETPARPVENGSPPAVAAAAPRGPVGQQLISRNTFYYEQGALGVISTNKGHGTVNVTGGGRADGPDMLLPRIAIESEHYGRIARSILQGQPVTIEADIRNAWYDNPEMFNIVAEIPGREQPDEVVIIGGHFNSFTPRPERPTMAEIARR